MGREATATVNLLELHTRPSEISYLDALREWHHELLHGLRMIQSPCPSNYYTLQ